MPPLIFYIVVGVIPVLCLWYLFATLYLIFRDDMLASLMNRQTEMQYAYEDQVSSLHAQIDQLTSRKLLEEAALSTKMESLASRQVRLERRSAVVTNLAERVVPKSDTKNSLGPLAASAVQGETHPSPAAGRPATNPLLNGAFSTKLPPSVSAFAPVDAAPGEATLPVTAKPRPDGFDLRHSEDFTHEAAPLPERSSDARDPGDGSLTLAKMNASLDHIEQDQDRIVAELQTPLIGEMARFRAVLAEAGLSPARLALRDSFPAAEAQPHPSSHKANAPQEAVGGPFVPINLDQDGSAFEREAISLQDTIVAVEHLRRAISSVPLRKPLAGDPDVTSGFGARLDPFFGRPAMHTGIDLREDYGTDVHATAAGKVTIAGPDGGYGNMVEIDHGNGLSTRYAHMSVILVGEGQTIQSGQVVGRIGMTGRTTGPHLHYETRIDGEPVDPLRFLKAGARLFSESASPIQAN